MKKLILTAAALALLMFTACGHDIPESSVWEAGSRSEEQTTSEASADTENEAASDLTGEPTEEEIQEAVSMMEDMMNNCNASALPLPEKFQEPPADWTDYTFKRGVTLKAPAGLYVVNTYDMFEILSDSDDRKERTVTISSMNSIDWTEENTEEEQDEEYQKLMKLVCERLGISFAETDEEFMRRPLESLGYKANTRYDLIKSLLTITDEELENADKSTADAVRLVRGMTLAPFRDEAYIIESGNAHIFIHRYDDDRYWVNVMPSDDFEYCLMIKAADTDTALQIAVTADILAE